MDCTTQKIQPNGYTTSNPRRFDVDITSIRRRPNFDQLPRHFRVLFRCDFAGRKIHVVSTYFFRCNFNGQKIHIVSTYFFRYNFDGRKIHVVSRTFINVISMVKICTLFLLTFFDVILMGKDLTSFLVSCKLMKTFEKVFSSICNFKQLTCARLLSLNFSSKSPWCNPVPLKFES